MNRDHIMDFQAEERMNNEQDFEEFRGVKEVISGFTGGTTPNPKYYPNQWGDHREAAKVIYDPNKVSFAELVKHVFNTVDYEDSDGQFCDRGHSYSPVSYTHLRAHET